MALIKCSECDKMISDRAVSCPFCGGPVPKTIECPECKSSVPETSTTCPDCGYVLREELEPRRTTVVNQNPYPRAYASPNRSDSGYNSLDLPPEASRFNWGAFVLNVFWGCANGMPWTLAVGAAFFLFSWMFTIMGLGLVLFALLIAYSFYMGINGGRLAWTHKRWRDVDHFVAVQRSWNIWGIAIFVFNIIMVALAVVLFGAVLFNYK